MAENTLLDKLAGIEARYDELERLIADPANISDYEKVAAYAQERAEIADLVATRRGSTGRRCASWKRPKPCSTTRTWPTWPARRSSACTALIRRPGGAVAPDVAAQRPARQQERDRRDSRGRGR
ncbi:MAG: hypothetical protein KatS3mg051_0579 [Anaerolineae bacterium]|nr:MAG: hypothetical protein KatS3mg051_0579 [Anaerolineae bacterium]